MTLISAETESENESISQIQKFLFGNEPSSSSVASAIEATKASSSSSSSRSSWSGSRESEAVPNEGEDFLDIDIDISMGEETKEISKPNDDSNDSVKNSNDDPKDIKIKQELEDETSRNPKRKQSSVSLDEDPSKKSSKEWSSGNFGDDLMIKDVFCPNMDKRESSKKDKEKMPLTIIGYRAH